MTDPNCLTDYQIPSDAVIVIGRQFGSGGRTIGHEIACRLGIDYYDTEVFAEASRRLGLNPEIFYDHDEKKPSLLRTLMQGAFGIADNFHFVPLNGELIYQEQSRVIRDVCKKGPCVIVGRTADCILAGEPHLFSVFLHAPLDHRVNNILRRREALSKTEARDLALKQDKKREAYYNFYRGENKWGTATNYHLTVDTSLLDTENAASLIIQAFLSRIKSESNHRHHKTEMRSVAPFKR